MNSKNFNIQLWNVYYSSSGLDFLFNEVNSDTILEIVIQDSWVKENVTLILLCYSVASSQFRIAQEFRRQFITTSASKSRMSSQKMKAERITTNIFDTFSPKSWTFVELSYQFKNVWKEAFISWTLVGVSKTRVFP